MTYLLGGYMWLFVHRPFEIWPILGAARIERVYMLLMLVVWLLSPKYITLNRLNAAFGAFVLALVASWTLSPFPDNEKVVLTCENYLKSAVVFLLLITSVRSEKDFRTLVWIYIAAVGLYMTHSLWEYRNGRHVFRMGTARMIGVDLTYSDANTFAATLVYSLPMILPFWFEAFGWRQKRWILGYATLTTLCVLLTGSRTALMGILVFLGGYVLGVSKRRLRLLVLAAVAAPLIWNFLPEDRRTRFMTIIDPSLGPANAQASAEGRRRGWEKGVELWNAYPVLGVGPGAHAVATNHYNQSHHLYGEVLGEMGTIGAVCLVLIVWGFARNAWEVRSLGKRLRWKRAPFPAMVVYATLATVGLMLLMGFGGHNLFRYSWLWFGGFSALGTRFVREMAIQEAAWHADLATPVRA